MNLRTIGHVILAAVASIFWCLPVFGATEIGNDEYIIFYHNDALGSPLVVTDHNGNALWHEHSNPYGRSRDRVMPTGQEFFNDHSGSRKGYTGHLKDTGTDLVYMKARFYDPVVGRFYSNDPIGFNTDNPMMFNRYAYGNNSPYVYVDPDGQAIETWADLGQVLFEAGQTLGAAAATAVGYFTENEALYSAGAEGLKSEAADLALATGGALIPGASSQLLIIGKKAKKLKNNNGTNKVDDVINETLSSKKRNLTSDHTLTADEALEAGEKFLGKGYKEIGKTNSGVFRSADGTRQFRIDNGSISGSHAPNVPHVHLETFKPGANKPTVNNHIPFVD